MKRASNDPHKSGTVPEASKTKLKYGSLLQDFLDLQKEFVSKKRKLRVMRQKRETLVAEVGFLSQRRKSLLKLQHPKSVINNNDEHPKSCNILNVNSSKVLETNQNLGSAEEEVLMEKKSQNCLRVSKMVGKKKILWKDQDQDVILKV